MSNSFKLVRSAIAAFSMLFGLALLTGTPASAKSTCKGLAKGACESNSTCSFVNAFTRSDGVKVKAFCRAKPGQSAKKTKTNSKKTTAKAKQEATSADAKKTSAKKQAKSKTASKTKAKSKATDTAKTKTTKAKKAAKKTTKLKKPKTPKKAKVKKAAKKKVGS